MAKVAPFFLFWWLPHQKWSSPKRVPLFCRVTEQLSLNKSFGSFRPVAAHLLQGCFAKVGKSQFQGE